MTHRYGRSMKAGRRNLVQRLAASRAARDAQGAWLFLALLVGTWLFLALLIGIWVMMGRIVEHGVIWLARLLGWL